MPGIARVVHDQPKRVNWNRIIRIREGVHAARDFKRPHAGRGIRAPKKAGGRARSARAPGIRARELASNKNWRSLGAFVVVEQSEPSLHIATIDRIDRVYHLRQLMTLPPARAR